MIHKLKWHNKPQGDIAAIEAAVTTDLAQFPDLYADPSGLITHVVFLGNIDDGPVVHVWGEEGDSEFFHCKWEPEVKWVTLHTPAHD